VMVGMASAKEGPSKQNESHVPTPTIADVRAMLPVQDLKTGFEMLEMLKRITGPDLAPEKASLLITIYDSQNTASNDSVPDIPGQPTRERRLQLEVLEELTKVPTEVCASQILVVLQNYREFMNLQKDTHPRARLQLSMAQLIEAHINNPDIRATGSEYLASPAFKEWTKGRIATSLLDYQIDNISDNDDPNLTQRLTLIMETACLPLLEQMLKAPKRLARSAETLSRLTDTRPEKLISFIEKKGQLSDSQKYFIAYASLHRVVQKVRMRKSLLARDIQLARQAEQWRLELAPKTEKIKNGDQLLEQAAKKWEK